MHQPVHNYNYVHIYRTNIIYYYFLFSNNA